MSNNKQSSVELFIEQLEEKGKAYEETVGVRTVNICIDVSEYMELKQQAKAMHKEEMKNFTEDWYHNGPLLGVDVLVSTSIEKHYNETFGGNNEQ